MTDPEEEIANGSGENWDGCWPFDPISLSTVGAEFPPQTARHASGDSPEVPSPPGSIADAMAASFCPRPEVAVEFDALTAGFPEGETEIRLGQITRLWRPNGGKVRLTCMPNHEPRLTWITPFGSGLRYGVDGMREAIAERLG